MDSRTCGQSEIVAPSNIISALRVNRIRTEAIKTCNLLSVNDLPEPSHFAKLLHKQCHQSSQSDLQVGTYLDCWFKISLLFIRDTLTKLEIDHSIRLSDAVVPDLLKLSNIRLLSMAGKQIICLGKSLS